MAGMLPRKDTARAQSNASLRGVAYQIGVLIAIERNRLGLTQEQLGTAIGVHQVAISNVENGLAFKVTDAKVDALFTKVGLGAAKRQREFVKWWRENA